MSARNKEKRDKSYYQRIGAMGGSRRGRGYFGYLKDTDPKKLKEISEEAGRRRVTLPAGRKGKVAGDKVPTASQG